MDGAVVWACFKAYGPCPKLKGKDRRVPQSSAAECQKCRRVVPQRAAECRRVLQSAAECRRVVPQSAKSAAE